MKELRNLPTRYLEAKPARAVAFGEVAAAIVPEDISLEAMDVLQRNRVKAYTYRPGDAEDRLRAVNQAADESQGTRFLISENHAYNALRDIAYGKPYGILQNPKYGEIQYPLGKDGKRGFGFLHIVESRMRKDHASLQEALDIAIKVGIAAEIGEEVEQRLNRNFHFRVA